MRRICFYHAGCPDGFGAAWAVSRAWGSEHKYIARGHDEPINVATLTGTEIAFVDIAPSNEILLQLDGPVSRLTVLDHHVSSRDRFQESPSLAKILRASGHHVEFNLNHSGAILAWKYFHPGSSPPQLLSYVEDQDLWNWQLDRSREVNAALESYPFDFDTWTRLTEKPIDQLADEGVSIVRDQTRKIGRVLKMTHPIQIGKQRIEAANAIELRAHIGHQLASRARYEVPAGVVYRVAGTKVFASIYSIGEFDVAKIASERGGGGHRNAAGFTVPLKEWMAVYL